MWLVGWLERDNVIGWLVRERENVVGWMVRERECDWLVGWLVRERMWLVGWWERERMWLVGWCVRCTQELLPCKQRTARPHRRVPRRCWRWTTGDRAWTRGETAAGVLQACWRGIQVCRRRCHRYASGLVLYCLQWCRLRQMRKVNVPGVDLWDHCLYTYIQPAQKLRNWQPGRIGNGLNFDRFCLDIHFLPSLRRFFFTFSSLSHRYVWCCVLLWYTTVSICCARGWCLLLVATADLYVAVLLSLVYSVDCSCLTLYYTATSNNAKLVHWPLIGGLLHLVHWGGAWEDWGPAQLYQTAHPSMASVPITVLLLWSIALCF